MKAVASMVTAGYTLCDVGTDHGYVPIALVQSNIIPKAIAVDINKGPLERANEHIRANGLTEQITTRLSNGLEAIHDGEVDSIVIAGMGGELVIHILTAGETVCRSAKELILQPQSEVSKVREYVRNTGYKIVDEDMILEDGKYYPMMSVTKKETAMPLDNPYRNAKDIDFLYGAYLLKEGHPVLQDYLKREAQIYRELLEKLSAISDRPEIQKRIHEVEKKAEQTERAIQEMSK
mgnify:CR=1 FL=1